MADVIVRKNEDGEADQEYLQVVYAEVYAPNRLDAHNEYMTAEEIRKMAWRFLASGKTGQIDIQHDNEVVKAFVVESFIARDDDPLFIPGSWVVGVYIEDPKVWQMVLDGELNGFSMEAYVTREERTLEVQMPTLVSGDTTEAEGHSHRWYVSYSPDGEFLGGSTDRVNGHFHNIRAGTITEPAAGHTHRFAVVHNMDVISSAVEVKAS